MSGRQVLGWRVPDVRVLCWAFGRGTNGFQQGLRALGTLKLDSCKAVAIS